VPLAVIIVVYAFYQDEPKSSLSSVIQLQL